MLLLKLLNSDIYLDNVSKLLDISNDIFNELGHNHGHDVRVYIKKDNLCKELGQGTSR